MKLEFFGQSARDADNFRATSARLVNCYREPSAGGAVVKSDLGTVTFADLPGIFVRAAQEVGDLLYVLCDGRLYSLTAGGVVTDIGAVADGDDGAISGNNGIVTVTLNGDYYTWNGVSLANPTPGQFSAFGSHDYVGNYTVLSEEGGRQFCWSDFADATDLPALNFSTADGRDDDIIRVVNINGLLYIFKQHSHEVWYLTGNAGASAFERQAGGVVDTGLKSFGLLAKIDGGAFFVGDDGRAHIIGVGPVSTPAVETAIKTEGPESCITWEDEGHTMCAIVFHDAPAWVYDVATGEWHERAQGAMLGPLEATVSAKFGDDWFIGRTGGQVLKMERNNRDAGYPLVRLMVSATLEGDGGYINLREVEVFPRIMDAGALEMRLSVDGGHTWGRIRQVNWTVGDYARRVIWRALGKARRWTCEIRVSDAVEIPIMAEGRIA